MNLKLKLLLISVYWGSTKAYENEYGPEYGNEWIYFVDDNDTTHVLNFSSFPEDGRGILFGDVYFHLYTRCNPTTPETLEIPRENNNIESKYFNSSHDIKMVTHGWMSSDSTEWLQDVKAAYLRKYDYNVITVDWSEISKNPIYPWPALSTRYVGKRVSKLLSSLMKTYEIDGQNTHLIGHSLGAQVMGYAGMFSKKRISRITGLDPARPLFEFPYMSPSFRLDKSDADFVDIIHTCAGVYGYRMSHGHADFYPNGGKPAQPGCEGVQSRLEGCSHGRSCLFYGESIESETGFIARSCENYNKYQRGECRGNATFMGDPVSTASSGDYYLHTNDKSNYARGDE